MLWQPRAGSKARDGRRHRHLGWCWQNVRKRERADFRTAAVMTPENPNRGQQGVQWQREKKKKVRRFWAAGETDRPGQIRFRQVCGRGMNSCGGTGEHGGGSRGVCEHPRVCDASRLIACQCSHKAAAPSYQTHAMPDQRRRRHHMGSAKGQPELTLHRVVSS